MKKSLSRVLSIVLTVAMMLTLLPATFVSAANEPVFTLSIVDGEGNAVGALNPGSTAYVRIGVSGIESIYNMAAGITATNATFNTDLSALNKRFGETGTLGELFEINNEMQGAVVTSSLAKFKLTKISTVSPAALPVAASEFVLVDVPFTVPAGTEVGAEISFDFSAAENDTNIQTTSNVADFYCIGDPWGNVITAEPLTVEVAENPYSITSVALKTALDVIPLGADFPGFGEDNRIVATYDLDRDGDQVMDTAEYEIVTNAAAEGKAYIDITSFNKDAMGTYTFDVTVTDSAVLNSPYTGEDAVSVTVGDAARTGEITADTTKVVEVKYGADYDAVKAAINARTDLFKDIYTDGSQVAATYTVAVENIDAAAYVNTTVGTEQTVTVTAVEGTTVVDGSVKVKVLPATITGVALENVWVNYPELPEGTEFPGFDGNRIVATFDPATSAIENATFDIVTDAAADETAYVDVTPYDAAAAGDYTLPVVVTTAAIAEPYTGSIILTVDPAAETDNVALLSPYLRIDFTEDELAAKTAAETLVLAAEGMFYTILTNDTTGAVADAVFATSVLTEYSALDNAVFVTITDITPGKTLVGDNVVRVSLGEPPATKANSAKFVDGEGVEVTPAIKAAIAEYEEDPAKLTLDWSAYDLTIEYANPNPEAAEETPYLTATYEYSVDGTNGTYTVEGWADFTECGEVGEQVVTVKVYDASKAAIDGQDYAYIGTLTAEITEADTTGIVKIESDTEVKVKNRTTEEEAIEAVTDKDGLFVELFKDGSTKTSDVKATTVAIAEYDGTVAGDYVATVTAIDSEEVILDTENATLTVVVKSKNVGGGTPAGTVTNKPETDDAEDETTTEGTTTEGTTTEPETTPEDETTEEEPVKDQIYFADVKDGHWAKDAVFHLAEKGIIAGDSNYKIRPDDAITREEASKIIALAAKYELGDTTLNFTDSAAVSEWAVEYVAASVANGAFTGFPDGTFAPQGTVTREQFAAIVIRAFNFGESTNELTFADAETITWSKGYVAKASELGIITGYAEDNTFRPAGAVTRAEAFAMLSRALTLKEALDAAMNTVIIPEETTVDNSEEDGEDSGDPEGSTTAPEGEEDSSTSTTETTTGIDVNEDGVINEDDDVNNDGVIDQDDVDEFNS